MYITFLTGDSGSESGSTSDTFSSSSPLLESLSSSSSVESGLKSSSADYKKDKGTIFDNVFYYMFTPAVEFGG